MADTNSTSNIQIGDTVQIIDTRFALSWSPVHDLYQELWRDYGNRSGKVVAFTHESPHLPGMHDADACVIQFNDGSQVSWEKHFLTRLSPFSREDGERDG